VNIRCRVTDADDSPCVDAGDFYADFGLEPAPNGGRINVGVYGNTEHASMSSSPKRYLLLATPVAGGTCRTTCLITWQMLGDGWGPGDTLLAEFSDDGGLTWNIIPGADALAYDAFLYSWDIHETPAGTEYIVRLTSNEDATTTVAMESMFTIDEPIYYYVNDTYDVASDVYCTASGDDANDGLTPATPKATVQAIIDEYDLEPGDVVYVDTGTYVLTANVVVGTEDAGDATGQVTFMGSPDAVGTLIDRNNTSSGAYGFHLNYADHVSLARLTVTGGQHGIYLVYSNNCSATYCRTFGNLYDGIEASRSNGLTCEHSVLDHNGRYGVQLYYSDDVSLVNNTLYLNESHQVYLYASANNASIRNNVVSADGAGDYGIYVYSSASISSSDYNDVHVTNGALAGHLGGAYATLYDWQMGTGFDAHSLSVDPLFVDPDGADDVAGTADDDLHLQSTMGSWHGGMWAADAEASPCIDAGDPSSDVSPEPVPNGARVNLGAYGRTEQASMTPTTLALIAPIGGELWRECPTILWNVNGVLWVPTDTVSLFYSPNNGLDWYPIAGGANLPGTLQTFLWDVRDLPPGDQYLVRIECDQDAALTDMSMLSFAIGGQYFVNDASTDDDEYCTAPGNAANDGLTRSTPKDSVQDVLDIYDLKPGDVVYVDTGTYTLTANITVAVEDGGSAADQVRLVGVRGKTTIDRNDSSTSGTACFSVSADFVTVTNFTCMNGYYGVLLNIGADDCVISNNILSGNGYHGVYAYRSYRAVIDHNVIEHVGSAAAIFVRAYSYYGYYRLACTISNNIVISSDAHGIQVNTSGDPLLKNNIIHTSGAGVFCIYAYDIRAITTSNFNDLIVQDGAAVGRVYNYIAPTLADWQSATGWDIDSLSLDPLFADPDNGDYHLMSIEGRWDPAAAGGAGGFVADSITSPCIDAGDTSDAVSTETDPNGGRINMGAYGGTAEASRSLERWLVLEQVGRAETLHAYEAIRWSARGSDWTPSETVRLEYSDDSGASWYPISGAEALPYDAICFWWDSRTVPDGDQYRFRVLSNAGIPVSATADRDYIVFNTQPPDAPVGPTPVDRAIDVPVDTNLFWTDAAGATSYDVYLNGELICSDTPDTMCDPAGNLDFLTPYTWQVIAKNSAGDTAGPEWSFTTECESPVADFSTDTLSGCAPLEVCFTDLSTGEPTSWYWEFGDGGTSTEQNPCYTYGQPGCYTVTLTVANDCTSGSETKVGHICTYELPDANFSAEPTAGYVPIEVEFTDLSTGEPTAWHWTFGDGDTSDEQHPIHTYDEPGLYTVVLTVENPCGSDMETKVDFIVADYDPATCIHLLPGYNSVGPIRDYVGLLAQDVLDEINAQGGCATAIYKWRPEFSAWLAHFDGFPPNNFLIENGAGYFVYSTYESDWCQNHGAIPSPLEIGLAAGFNFISLPEWFAGIATAQDLLDEINAQGGTATAIYMWRPEYSAWLAHFDGFPPNNFSIESGVGYMVYCTAESVLVLDNGFGE